MIGQQNATTVVRNRHSFGGKGINDETLGVAAKQFGLGKFIQFHQTGLRYVYFFFVHFFIFCLLILLRHYRRIADAENLFVSQY